MTQQDALCCPRCTQEFHDIDVENNPDDYFQCLECGAIQHTACRGELVSSKQRKSKIVKQAWLKYWKYCDESNLTWRQGWLGFMDWLDQQELK